MEDNRVLEAVVLTEYIKGSLCSDSRVQLSRTNLESIKRLLGQVITKLTNRGEDFSRINFYLLGAHNLIETVLEEDTFDKTNTKTKDILSEHINDALDGLYIAAGKFYDTQCEFRYNLGCDEVLHRIIDRSIRAGYYFGQA
ncbi:MAG: hypothetical protein IJE43_18990 [Alphaproteobacteria bacterium]|nr:hypothetical protein [Alphaproteobacteria bacterium]